jgi:indolepyruvate ferredoxin oxidoreductase beta subunit
LNEGFPGHVGEWLAQMLKISCASEPAEFWLGVCGLLLEAAARGVALWMTFEDPIRVADLKTRASRFARVRDEIRAGTLPAALGRWTGGKQIRTRTLRGFLALHVLSGFKRWRGATLRFHEEDGRIEAWLARITQLAPRHYALAVEFARAQRLIKGYGETHERGWRNFQALAGQLEFLEMRSDGAVLLAGLTAAALADEAGQALDVELARLAVAGAGAGAQALHAS